MYIAPKRYFRVGQADPKWMFYKLDSKERKCVRRQKGNNKETLHFLNNISDNEEMTNGLSRKT